MSIPILYLIHRVQHPSKPVNIALAKEWFVWLVDSLPDAVILSPWLVYAECLDEDTYRARGMRDGKLLAGLTGISAGIVCGPEITQGCQNDINNLWDHGLPSISLCALGMVEPPSHRMGDALAECLDKLVGRLLVMRASRTRMVHVGYEHVPSFTTSF